MNLKKLTALGMACAVAAGSLAACGNSEQSAGPAGEQSGGSGASASEAAETSSQVWGDGTYNITWDDMAEVNMVYMSQSSIPSGLQEVEDAINEITEAEINTHVNLEMIEVGNYIQQVSLKMSSSEPVDIILTFPGGAASFSGMQTQGQLMDITDLMSEYGQPILDTVGDFMKATTVNGSIYAVPAYRDFTTSFYLVMRTDVLEDLGLLEQAQNIQCFADLEPILEAVNSSEKWSYLSGLASASGNGAVLISGGSFPGLNSADETIYFDNLGSVSESLGVNPDGSDPTVQLVAGTQAYKDTLTMAHDWYEKGYIYKDAATEKEMAATLVKSNTLFGYLCASEMGVEASAAANCGMPMTCVKLLTLPITTGSCTKFTWAVPASSRYPEAAVTFLSMMYTDSRIANLLAWGIEGRDYVVEDGVAKYPEGTAEAPYHSADFLAGNQFLVYPWEGQDVDIRQQAQDQMAQAYISPYLGFTCDTDPITTEIAAITTVINEFGPQLNSGIADPEEVLPQYLEKLEASNIQKVIDEYQAQLDAWIEGNGVDAGSAGSVEAESGAES